jgi:hypothetical protein
LVRGPADVKLQPTNSLDKPVLDPIAFQQLLAAAYTLQEQNVHLLEKAKADFLATLCHDAGVGKVHPIPSVSLAPLAALDDSQRHPEMNPQVPNLAQEILEAKSSKSFRRRGSKATQLSPVCPVRSGSGHKGRRRIAQSNELFWRAATAVAMAAVLALLLVASIDRLAPLPAGLILPSEAVQQPIPFHKSRRAPTTPAQSGGVGKKTVVTEPHAMPLPGPNDRTVVADEPLERGANPASAEKAVVNPNRIHSAYESEADVVAQNTVVRYGTRSPAPRVQAQKP